ncbi:MAG: hypothetical protein R3F62_16615 [Planctomycetota bacterium]
MLALLPVVLFALPLIAVVFAAVLYASFHREHLGRAGPCVIFGGCLVEVALLTSLGFQATIQLGALSHEALTTAAIGVGIVSALCGTLGWSLVLLAVFLDRGPLEELD